MQEVHLRLIPKRGLWRIVGEAPLASANLSPLAGPHRFKFRGHVRCRDSPRLSLHSSAQPLHYYSRKSSTGQLCFEDY